MAVFKFLRSLSVATTIVVASASSFAGVIGVENYASGTNGASESGLLAGYNMTRFDEIAPTSATNSLVSPVDGSAVGITSNDSDGQVTVEVAYSDVNASSAPLWWINESRDENNDPYNYNIFTTSSNTITVFLPENTLAFAFNVGANQRGQAWFHAYSNQSNAVDYDSGNFYVGGSGNKTPGYGLYADNSNTVAGQCNYISKVVVDPRFIWGIGNFSIAQDTNGDCSTTEVTEPGTLALFGMGLIGMILMRRRMT